MQFKSTIDLEDPVGKVNKTTKFVDKIMNGSEHNRNGIPPVLKDESHIQEQRDSLHGWGKRFGVDIGATKAKRTKV